MLTEKPQTQNYAHDIKPSMEDLNAWRRACGCIKTSEKLKQMLSKFPAMPPPTPTIARSSTVAARPVAATDNLLENSCISAQCKHGQGEEIPLQENDSEERNKKETKEVRGNNTYGNASWHIIIDLLSLVQMSVTATALALYYLIYCYMQLVYYTLKSALYFHNADGPMKITIAVVMLTSMVLGFNLVLRMERIVGMYK